MLKEYLYKIKNKLNKNTNLLVEEESDANKSYIYPNSTEEFNSILIETINNFFPDNGRWGSDCFKRPNDTLQSNLRNNELLAKLLLKKSNLSENYYDRVLDYITTSDLFKQKVHEYEQSIVKWQIIWMKNGGENWICDDRLGGDLSLILPNCDIAFRKGVVDTLLAMGLDREAIEEGLEKNANLWRNQYIEGAFIMKFEPINYKLSNDDNTDSLPATDPKHMESWIKMRKYEYYCNHAKSVNLYGSVEPDMLLTKQDYYKLKFYLDIANKERLELISSYKNKTQSLSLRLNK